MVPFDARLVMAIEALVEGVQSAPPFSDFHTWTSEMGLVEK